MKYRSDFVTNSSSSSYTCDICGRTESGWDMGLSEAEMVECVNGHTFCADEMLELSKEQLIKLILSIASEDDGEDYSENALKRLDADDLTIVCQKFNLNPADIVAGWKEKFGTYADFHKYLWGD